MILLAGARRGGVADHNPAGTNRENRGIVDRADLHAAVM
jgi:hypothetical protein